MNSLTRIIVFPEKLVSLAAMGLLFLFTKLLIWLSAVTGLDLTGLPVEGLAAALAVVLTVLAKYLMERYIPEKAHAVVNSFLAWLAGLIVADVLFKAVASNFLF